MTRRKLRAYLGEVGLGAFWGFKLLCRLLRLNRWYLAVLAWLVRRTGLFDAEYYLDSYADVAQAGVEPLLHYAAYGDRELRSPMPLLEPGYYLRHSNIMARRTNTLLHYVWVGRYLGYSPSPWFDVDFYLSDNPDVFMAGIDPLLHYVRWGGGEGRAPTEHFDGHHYLSVNPDVKESGENPLVHYLRQGRQQGKSAIPLSSEEHGAAINPQHEIPWEILSTDIAWGAFIPRAFVHHALVDVIVPVYKGRIETLRCLYSVLTSTCETPFELVVVNDASPDEDLSADLLRLSGLGLFTLLQQEENSGFVRVANRGMAEHTERDVVLLNSDAEVYGEWLDRLRHAANRHERTGTVTPLSNNATICSYPRFLHDNPYPLEIPYSVLNEIAARENDGEEVEAPTAVGFCMYIKRACMNECGYFDAETFGNGYGEENDFCQRIMLKGWRNIISPDVFVRHWGATSFRGERAKRASLALRTINQRYPNYRWDIRKFIDLDPVRSARCNLDWGRLKVQMRARNVLIVCQSRGGSAERYIREDVSRIGRDSAAYFLRPQKGGHDRVMLTHSEIKALFNVLPYSLDDLLRLADALSELNITDVHIHSLAEFSSEAPERMLQLVEVLGAVLEVHLHDYRLICPQINLVRNGKYCGEPDEDECDRCLKSHRSAGSIRTWRSEREKILRCASRVIVPDRDMADRLLRYFPEVAFEVRPHESIALEDVCVRQPTIGKDEKLKVVVIGALGKIKGFDIFCSCAERVRQQNLPIEFVLMGYSSNDARLREMGVTVTGRYLEQEANDRLKEIAAHVAWFPNISPKSYSYTLSLALKAGLPVMAFDIGAIANRLRDLDSTSGLMPMDWIEQPDRVIDKFVQFRLNAGGQ